MSFDLKTVVGDIVDDLRTRAQDLLDSTQVDDRVAEALNKIGDALDGLAGRVEQLDTDETDSKGEPERSVTEAKEAKS